MKPSINIDPKDPKLCLLSKIFKFIDDEKTRQSISRNDIHNINRFRDGLKIIMMSQFFDYTMSNMIDELNRNEDIKKYFNIKETMEAQKFYEFMSRSSPEQVNSVVNNILKRIPKKNRKPIKTYIIDATPVEVDINTVKKYVSKEKLEELKLKWGYAKTKGYYIGFKVTVTLDKETLCPISILIHPGSPNDAKLFEPILHELKRRKLLAKRTIILCDRGYFSKKNYEIGISGYKIVPVIFPRGKKTPEQLTSTISYPLDIYKERNLEEHKQLYKTLKRILIQKLTNWKELKPVRGLIEDFFKVGKEAFGLGKFHKYTMKSTSKSVYICILLTAICIQQGYNTKTKMQQLAEGNVTLKPVKKHRRKKHSKKLETEQNPRVPYKTKQVTLLSKPREVQTTLC